MHRLLSSTSISIDEAISILLGRTTGPIEIVPFDGTEVAKANCPIFDLEDHLEDERDLLAGEYEVAKHEKRPADVIAEKLKALRDHETMIERANGFLCAIKDELNKGEDSMLRVDRKLSNPTYTFITLHSFNEWAKSVGADLGAEPPAPDSAAESGPACVEGAKEPKRPKSHEQEDAILEEIRNQGFDPEALAKNPPGKKGVKAAVREALNGKWPFDHKKPFDNIWQSLRNQGRIAEQTDPPPHKKLMGETSRGG